MAELELWMRVGRSLESVLGDPSSGALERTLDAWQSGGVRGLVVGPLVFENGDAAFTPNPTAYRRWDTPTPVDPAGSNDDLRAQLVRLLDLAKGRGWPIYLYDPAFGAGDPIAGGTLSRSTMLLADERYRRAYLARLEDTVTQFPQAEGILLDGPEWGYEIAPGHPSNLFDDLPPEMEGAARALGFDYPRLVAAKDRLFDRLHKLSRESATLGAHGGVFNALHLLGNDPGIASWLAFRQRALTAFYKQAQQVVEALTRARAGQVKLGISPRMPSLAALCGYDFPATASLFDLIVPKMHVWHRGAGGLYGTVYRYTSTLMEWNSGLWEAEAFAATRALLGVALPSAESGAHAGQTVATLREMDRGFPESFFSHFMVDEAKRAIAAGDGYAWRVLPSVAAGPRPGGGDPITAADLRRLLVALKEGGIRHVLYDEHQSLTPASWTVLSEYCGYGWRQGEGLHGQYVPPGV